MLIAKFTNFGMENYLFFLGKLYQKLFLSQSLLTLGILHTKFGSIWTTLWPNKKDLFSTLFKFKYSKYSQYSVWKPNFFPRQAIAKIFLFYNLGNHGILHTEFGLIWTTPEPDEKELFLKFANREIRKIPYGKLTIFLGKLYQKFFLSQGLPTLGILHTKFGLIWTTPWSNQKDLFSKLFKIKYSK